VNVEGKGEVAETLPGRLDGRPEWSPDGQWILFSTQYDVGKPEDSEIYLLRSDDSQLTLLPHNSGGSFDPSWSPDGKQIVYYARDALTGIYILNVECFVNNEEACNPVPMFLVAGDAAPDWSPNGREIVYEQAGQILKVNADGTTTQPVSLTQQGTHCVDPQWSPDGKRIAFSCDGIIYLADPDGSNLVSLSQTGAYPSWSHDGSKIAFISAREGQEIGLGEPNISNAVYLMDIDGSNVIRLSLRDDEIVNWLAWIPSEIKEGP
jgi:Tol biopolymer transport system component